MEEFTPTQLQQIARILSKELHEHELRLKYDRLKTTLSIKEAAGILSCGETSIRKLIKTGYLEVVKILGKTYVTTRSLKEIQKPK